ncbi:hypothetical protein FC70_GL000877 [Paucilactobacillus oligofermentans DSM 15707 = LMG 22743]|uniref:Lipoprotein n=1 Tax=Paucilactobacillus oligofermentans DSM 15707 = LMG 22743 TaxID=1423778 RepID=A0A0R1RFC1_9LACO|nr:hypothetical protein [Paucilactobacillus oligofermentans]KRL55281.1 hypothetical protein FC70_GL000877 [Paucilactobacillus oligofermentans DSM 15707 = LMG 22743]CUS25728.1 Uncharacterized protein LACOL_0420 [Paucilactobacillus oligofermentans DSM 15707 = LMG 22743]
MKKFKLIGLIVMALLLIGGCGNQKDSAKDSSSTASTKKYSSSKLKAKKAVSSKQTSKSTYSSSSVKSISSSSSSYLNESKVTAVNAEWYAEDYLQFYGYYESDIQLYKPNDFDQGNDSYRITFEVNNDDPSKSAEGALIILSDGTVTQQMGNPVLQPQKINIEKFGS